MDTAVITPGHKTCIYPDRAMQEESWLGEFHYDGQAKLLVEHVRGDDYGGRLTTTTMAGWVR